VLWRDDDVNENKVERPLLVKWMSRAQREAGLTGNGGLHILRHTFCSHLAMRGATLMDIMKLAGHRDVQTTMRYMHLSPNATDKAIRLLDGPFTGDILETGLKEALTT
jgi:site-specific recombinase XerD